VPIHYAAVPLKLRIPNTELKIGTYRWPRPWKTFTSFFAFTSVQFCVRRPYETDEQTDGQTGKTHNTAC